MLVHIYNCTPSKHYIARLSNKMCVLLKYISNVSPLSPAKITCVYTLVYNSKKTHLFGNYA